VKPDLLFISPAVPAPLGNGPAMRAHASIRVLAIHYRVHLLVANDPPRDAGQRRQLEDLCAEVAYRPLGLWPDRWACVRQRLTASSTFFRRLLLSQPREWNKAARLEIGNPFDVREFAVAHVFRFYLAPLLETLGRSVAVHARQLDVDDIESLTRRRLAGLYRLAGHRFAALEADVEAALYEKLESDWLPRFDRVFVSSSRDRELLLQRHAHPSPEVLPNTVEISRRVGDRASSDTFRFLFVGTMSYYPNVDGVLFFCSEILPLIRARASKPITVTIIGSGMSLALRETLSMFPEVQAAGFVEHLEQVYRDADAVLVPIRAGGGTRIKVLEAFAHHCPVVSTSAGIEGIEVEEGTHALIADTPEEFANACLRLIREPRLGRELGQRAFELVSERYSDKALSAALIRTRSRAGVEENSLERRTS